MYLVCEEADIMKAVAARRARGPRLLLRSRDLNLCRKLVTTFSEGPGKIRIKTFSGMSLEQGTQMRESEGSKTEVLDRNWWRGIVEVLKG